MPLPPALAAKLAKRGIIKNAEVPKEKTATEPNSETESKSDAGKTVDFFTLVFILFVKSNSVFF